MTTTSNAHGDLPASRPSSTSPRGRRRGRTLAARKRTREGDAIAAARRRLPMVEVDGTVEVTGANGPAPFLDLFEGRGTRRLPAHAARRRAASRTVRRAAPPRLGTCGRRISGAASPLPSSRARGGGRTLRRFHGLHRALVLVRDVAPPIGGEMGLRHLLPARRRPHVFTYSTTGRGNEVVNGSLGLLDMTPYGRRGGRSTPMAGPKHPTPALSVGGHGADLLVLAHGRQRRRDLGRHQPAGSCNGRGTRAGPVQTLGRKHEHH